MKQLFILTLTILTSWLITGNLQAEGRIYIDITSPEARKINVGVPQIINQSNPLQADRHGRDLARLMDQSLELQGIFSLIPENIHLNNQSADWKRLGADYAVLGNYSLSPRSIQLELKLLDVATGQIILGKRYNGSGGQEDEIIYKFADLVVEELTGQSGIASGTIAFISDATGSKELYVSDPLGRDIRQLTRHKSLVVSPRFTPDGQSVSYTSFHSGNSNLYLADLKQGRSNKVLSRQSGMNLAPTWEPNGRSLILTLSKDGNPDLYQLDTNGRVLRQLTRRAGINVSASWSPDGKNIAFVSDRSGTPQVYIMELASSKVQRITFDGNENAEPVWSPKGDLIAYTGKVNGSYQIFTVRPGTGATPFQVTGGPGDHEMASWTPDGNQLVYTRKIGQQQQLYLIHKNGSNQRPLFPYHGNVSSPRWTR